LVNDRRQIERESRLSQRQVESNRDKKDYKEYSQKFRAKEELKEDSRKRQTVRNSHNGSERSVYRQRSGRDRDSASLNRHRFR
jgi:hypothetical protein